MPFHEHEGRAELTSGMRLPDANCPSWPQTPWPPLHLTSLRFDSALHRPGTGPSGSCARDPAWARQTGHPTSRSEGGRHAGGECLPRAWRAQPDAIKGLTQLGCKRKSDAAVKSVCWGRAVPNSSDLLQLPLSLGFTSVQTCTPLILVMCITPFPYLRFLLCIAYYLFVHC